MANKEHRKYDSHVLVIHGVGDQRRGETAAALAGSLGKMLGTLGYAPVIGPGFNRFSASNGVYHPINTNQISDLSSNEVQIQVWECYWADLSSLSRSLLGKVSGFWRILVGLPKLGYLAIKSLPEESFFKKQLLFFFAVSWLLVSIRLISLSLIVFSLNFIDWLNNLGIDMLSQVPRRWHEYPTIVVDFVANIFYLLLGVAYILFRFSAGRSERIRNGLKIAVVSLAVGQLMTMHVPSSIDWAMSRWLDTNSTATNWSDTNNQPLAETSVATTELYGNLYSSTVLCGAWSYFVQGAFILVFIVAGVVYLSQISRDSVDRADENRSEKLNRLLLGVSKWSYRLALLLVFCGPLLWLMEFTAYQLTRKMLLIPFPTYIQPYVLLFSIGQVALVASLLLFEKIRGLVRPIYELLLDVASYFPAIDWLETRPRLAQLMGAKTPKIAQSLNPELTARLASMIATVSEESQKARVIIVSHSLGTVIAYDSLRDSALLPPDSLKRLSLLTMGSPIGKLHCLFPYLFPAQQIGIPRWSNLYRMDDYVGTKIEGAISQKNVIAEKAIGVGGHMGYFDDPAIATEVLEMSATT